jgi:hypothetical protein
VRPLDARHVDETGRAAEQRAARKVSRGTDCHPPSVSARAIGDALAAREGVADRRVRLETLEFLERRERRVGIVEVDDKADRNQILVEVIEERTAPVLRSSGQPKLCWTRPS